MLNTRYTEIIDQTIWMVLYSAWPGPRPSLLPLFLFPHDTFTVAVGSVFRHRYL